ncbi:class B sortase [Caloramator sp. E03]|uniref:class B sortase n=1 Tax=Caloramator sp. E03 TaxID=2576307 RepID=UPI0011102F78|nr:class B sortase [Caloramator sp. E03]QCX32908.1 class B sortase [Caloramator sp. E03]
MKINIKKSFGFIFLLIAIISMIDLIYIFYEYKKDRDMYSELVKSAVYNESDKKIEFDNSLKVSNSLEKININEDKLKSINSDYKFWIRIENTKINYPVVQGKDNDYYTIYDFERKKRKAASIFIDCRNDMQKDKNIIIYGHNMHDGSMFHDLIKFKDKNFFENNKTIEITINNKKYIYEIFSVYVTSSSDNYLITAFSSPKDFMEYISKAKSKSLFKNNLEITSDDKIITLSTCSYEFNDARTVVHAKLIKQ